MVQVQFQVVCISQIRIYVCAVWRGGLAIYNINKEANRDNRTFPSPMYDASSTLSSPGTWSRPALRYSTTSSSNNFPWWPTTTKSDQHSTSTASAQHQQSISTTVVPPHQHGQEQKRAVGWVFCNILTFYNVCHTRCESSSPWRRNEPLGYYFTIILDGMFGLIGAYYRGEANFSFCC